MAKDYIQGFQLLVDYILSKRDEYAKLSAYLISGKVPVMEDNLDIPADKLTIYTTRKVALETKLAEFCQAANITIPEKVS